MVRAIQLEWIFLQQFTWDTGDAFAGAEKMIQETFFPRLFFGKTKALSPVVGALSKMPAKKSKKGLLHPSTSAQEKYLISLQGSAELVRAVMGGGTFSNADLLWTLSEERHDGKKYRDVLYKSKLKGLVRNIKGTDKFLLLRTNITGAWPSVRGTSVSGTVVSATEFRDFLMCTL